MSEQPSPEFYFISQEQLLKDRRERIATKLMQGILANPRAWEEWSRREMLESAIAHTDSLIKELDGEGK